MTPINLCLEELKLGFFKKRKLLKLWPNLEANLSKIISIIGDTLKDYVTDCHDLNLNPNGFNPLSNNIETIMGQGIFGKVDVGSFQYKIVGDELGVLCKKQFSISVLGIVK